MVREEATQPVSAGVRHSAFPELPLQSVSGGRGGQAGAQPGCGAAGEPRPERADAQSVARWAAA